ncbi:MAG: DUF3301 domain-containing protein [Pseudomonadota bacterium]
MTDILLLFPLGVVIWYWLDSLRALEIARTEAKLVCNKANVQLLDDTVARISLALARNPSGRRALQRIYRFEFSETGDTRLEGRLTLLAGRVESVTMEPYRVFDD